MSRNAKISRDESGLSGLDFEGYREYLEEVSQIGRTHKETSLTWWDK